MLARLDGLPGVDESRVDWTGRYFLLKLGPDAERAGLVDDAGEILGSDVRPLEGAAAEAQLQAFRAGEPWMRSGETLRMSLEESKILARRFAERAAANAGLDPERARRLEDVVRQALDSAIGALHAARKPPDLARFRLDWQRLVGDVVERSRAFLTEDEAARVAEALLAALRR